MAITRTPIVDDDGTGTTGTVIDNAWKTELYNQIDGLAGGVWTDVPFNPANFWSDVTGGMVQTNRYMVMNKTMFWIMQVFNATVPNPLSPYLPFILPGGLQTPGMIGPLARAFDGTETTGYLFTLAPNTLGAIKSNAANWAAYPIHVYFSAVIPLL